MFCLHLNLNLFDLKTNCWVQNWHYRRLTFFIRNVYSMFSLILHDFGLHVRKETCGQLASEGERKELKRRTTLMLLYLLRSPFYENICE